MPASPAEKLAKKKKSKGQVPWGQRTAARRPSAFVARLRSLRLELGLTQDQVATGSGVNHATVVDAENGRDLYLTTALKLARFFGWSVEALWTEIAQ